jgi:outer membrane protein TolC
MCGAFVSVNAQDLGTGWLERSLVPSHEGRHITMEQAQQVATQANTLLARLAQLEVEAARQVRLAARADYFPKIGTAFGNFHFNKFMGQEFLLNRPITGGTVAVGIPLLGQDQTFVAVTATQPITPLFKVREAVALARADENIARAKAGMPVATVSTAVEKNYFELLIAQKEMALAEATVQKARAARLMAGSAFLTARLDESAIETEVDDAFEASSDRVRDLTASLNQLLGWPADTPLQLESPAPLDERLSFQDVVAAALQANVDVIEAEQNVRKADAASNLSKLDYVPDIAVTGGYVFQADVVPALPDDFSYIGVIGSYNIFDFFKREHSMRARGAQLRMARTALELTKAKVLAAVKTSYLELEQSRTAKATARGAAAAAGVVDAKSRADDFDLRAVEVRTAIEALRLDHGHRQAYARLQAVMGQRPEASRVP